MVLSDFEKAEGEDSSVRGASVRGESEAVLVFAGVLLRFVVQKSPLEYVDWSAAAFVSRLRDCVSAGVLRVV